MLGQLSAGYQPLPLVPANQCDVNAVRQKAGLTTTKMLSMSGTLKDLLCAALQCTAWHCAYHATGTQTLECLRSPALWCIFGADLGTLTHPYRLEFHAHSLQLGHASARLVNTQQDVL